MAPDSQNRRQPADYSKLSVLELVERIVDQSDRDALRALHDDRTPCRFRGRRCRIVEHVAALHDARLSNPWYSETTDSVDAARDLTIDRLINLPVDEGGGGRRGVDCRLYFRAFLDYVKEQTPTATLTPDRFEMFVARCLSGFVWRQFEWSLRQAIPRNPAASRYFWRVPGYGGAGLWLWMPEHIFGLERSRWLEKNVPDADPTRPGERDRVQTIIDERLGLPQFFPLEEHDAGTNAPIPDHVADGEPFASDLAKSVAEHKVNNINALDKTIKGLGRHRLRRLILAIFESIPHKEHRDAILAARFGLSTPTYSRFAGRKWMERLEKPGRLHIPVLWRNTAKIVKAHPDFLEAAREAGVLKLIDRLLARETDGGEHTGGPADGQ